MRDVGGFDPVYTTAGDDVDMCWKVLDRGWDIGFHPAADRIKVAAMELAQMADQRINVLGNWKLNKCYCMCRPQKEV